MDSINTYHPFSTTTKARNRSNLREYPPYLRAFSSNLLKYHRSLWGSGLLKPWSLVS